MKLKVMVLSLVAAGIVASGIAWYSAGEHPLFSAASATLMQTQSAAAAPSNAVATLPDFSGLVAKYGPAVVNISVTETERTAGLGPHQHGLDKNDPFYWFFRQFPMPVPHDYAMHGIGSGFIVRPDGVILTNAHVVDNASDVTVKLIDRREFTAKVLGIDKPSDIAVLKIDATDLPTVKLGKAADVKVGEWVVALGSPFGFENSATAGIVSAKLRSLPQETYIPFIQTDVAVNPGNSGGPLFDTRGEVIGINAQIYSQSGGYQGLSFAIPIDVATQVESQLLETGHVTRSHLGVTVQQVDQKLANAFRLSQPKGALVSSVEKNGPAAKAGVEPGDIIVKFNDKDVASSTDLPLLVASAKPGTEATLGVLRGGTRTRLVATLDKLESSKVASAESAGSEDSRLGLAVRPLTPQERNNLDVAGGVVVEGSSGPAAMAGIEPGDVILGVNGTRVKDPAQLDSLLAKAGKSVALQVQRDNEKLFVGIELG
jgi:serine protease Do